jgi:hypothetical protein
MILPQTDSKLFSTADLGIAVFLFTIGHELKKTTLQSAKRLIFHFARQEDTEEQVSKYMNETGQAPAKKLFENYRALRALAFSETGNLR